MHNDQNVLTSSHVFLVSYKSFSTTPSEKSDVILLLYFEEVTFKLKEFQHSLKAKKREKTFWYCSLHGYLTAGNILHCFYFFKHDISGLKRVITQVMKTNDHELFRYSCMLFFHKPVFSAI